jgi:hypothetical protein
MTNLVPPRSSEDLKAFIIPEVLRTRELSNAGTLKKVSMSSCEVCDLLLLSMGALYAA